MPALTFAHGLKLSSYENGWTISETRVYASGKRQGESYDYALGYHGTLPSALNGLLEHRLRRADAKSLARLADEVQAFRREVQDAFNVRGVLT